MQRGVTIWKTFARLKDQEKIVLSNEQPARLLLGGLFALWLGVGKKKDVTLMFQCYIWS